jgi:hypothetical protein
MAMRVRGGWVRGSMRHDKTTLDRCCGPERIRGQLADAKGGLETGYLFLGRGRRRDRVHRRVGENPAPVRAAICRACAWLGLELDEAANRENRERIGTPAAGSGDM